MIYEQDKYKIRKIYDKLQLTEDQISRLKYYSISIQESDRFAPAIHFVIPELNMQDLYAEGIYTQDILLNLSDIQEYRLGYINVTPIIETNNAYTSYLFTDDEYALFRTEDNYQQVFDEERAIPAYCYFRFNKSLKTVVLDDKETHFLLIHFTLQIYNGDTGENLPTKIKIYITITQKELYNELRTNKS